MTLAEIIFDWTDTREIDANLPESGIVNGIKAVHAPGVDGGVTLFHEQSVPDSTRLIGSRLVFVPIKEATNLPPGTCADFSIYSQGRSYKTNVRVIHTQKTKLIHV